MKQLVKILCFILFNLCWLNSTYAQVGVNTSSPNKYAIMDLKSTQKGVLFPRLTTTERFAIKTACLSDSCPEGLIVYDTDVNAFFYLSKKNWYMMNPFIAPDVTQATQESINSNLTIIKNVGIGTGNLVKSGKKLDVNGNVQVRAASNLKNTLTVKNGAKISTGKFTVATGSVIDSVGTATASGVIEAKNFSTDITKTGNGPAPQGSIIIWSGSIASIPAGWALCNGLKGTPNLVDRFVVGHAATDNTSVSGGAYIQNITGGENTHSLSVSEMPTHSHTGTANTAGDHKHQMQGYRGVMYYTCAGSTDRWVLNRGGGGASYGGEKVAKHDHSSLNIVKIGSGTAHENRPPYYVLAFIMKL